jgi:nitrite reductase/ring-hydroxylating ferredoxin subunit
MPSQFVRVAGVGDLEDGAMMLVTPEDQEIVLARVGDEYYAVDALCTHAYGMLDQGELEGYELECPIHAGRFDVRTGKATCRPALLPIGAYAVRVDGEDILVGPKA